MPPSTLFALSSLSAFLLSCFIASCSSALFSLNAFLFPSPLPSPSPSIYSLSPFLVSLLSLLFPIFPSILFAMAPSLSFPCLPLPFFSLASSTVRFIFLIANPPESLQPIHCLHQLFLPYFFFKWELTASVLGKTQFSVELDVKQTIIGYLYSYPNVGASGIMAWWCLILTIQQFIFLCKNKFASFNSSSCWGFLICICLLAFVYFVPFHLSSFFQ